MQAKTHNLALIAKKIGLNITIEKTKVIRSSSTQQVKIKLKRRSKIWVSLGSTTTVTGLTEEDVKCTLDTPRLALNIPC